MKIRFHIDGVSYVLLPGSVRFTGGPSKEVAMTALGTVLRTKPGELPEEVPISIEFSPHKEERDDASDSTNRIPS